MDKSTRYLMILAAVICAVLIGYNAFYVPDATMSELKATADSSSSVFTPASSGEAYFPALVSSKGTDADRTASTGAQIVSSGTASGLPHTSSRTSDKNSAPAREKININTASAQQLSEGIKGIGDSLAKRIVEYRNQHGSFQSVEDLKNVSGIGDAKLAAIRESITVE